MTDEPTIAAPVAPAVSAPAEAAVVAAPAAISSAVVSTEAPAVAPVEPPVIAPAPAVTEPVVPAAIPEPVVSEPVVEPVTEPAAEVVAQTAPKPFEFKLPDTVKADAATMTAYGNVLGKYGISQEAGQELIDFHANAIKATQDQMASHQQDSWASTNAGWVADFDKSAGNRRDTILNDAKFAITDTIKDAKQRKAMWDVLAFTGAGNHKDVINGLAAIGKRLREGSARSTGAPLNGARGGTAADRRYGGTNKPQA